MSDNDDNTLLMSTSDGISLRKLYPDRIPVRCCRDPKCKKLKDIVRTRYLVPKELPIGQFIYIIRKNLDLQPYDSLLLFVDMGNGNKQLPTVTLTFEQLDESVKSNDKIIYITYTTENSFGC